MHFLRGRITIRGLFVGLATLGLVANVIFDFVAFFDNQKLNKHADLQMLSALVIDAALIGVMLTLFLLSVRARKKTEESLKQSLANMRETLQTLEEQVFSRQVQTKTIVHDLKDPFGSILGFAQLLREHPGSQMTVLEFSERIQQISKRSLILVESMLCAEEHVAKIQMDKVNIARAVDEMVFQLDVQAKNKKQKIFCDIYNSEIYVSGHLLKLEEMISNLLSNAIKYSPIGAEIKIRLALDASAVELSIEDRGPGFSSQDKINAFQYGKRLSAKPTNGESSTGFGLYIVKEIVEMHFGEIHIQDASTGCGSLIVVRLPLDLQDSLKSDTPFKSGD